PERTYSAKQSRKVFFFQAEDGIRDFHVTGVQTCALPIWAVKEMNKKYCSDDNGAIPTPSSGGIMDRLNSVQNARTEGAIDDVNMWWAATKSIPTLAVALDQVGDPLFWPIAFKKGSKLREELLPHVKEFLNSPRAKEVSLMYGMERNVFIKEDPDAVVQQVLESRRQK